MKQEIKNSVEQVKPWGKRTPWWILLIEGILAIGLGMAAMVLALALLAWRAWRLAPA
mgnify:CR=1 FL=1